MAVMDKRSIEQPRPRRNWKKPRTWATWLWLACSLLIYGGVSLWFYSSLTTQTNANPNYYPFYIFGIIAFCMVLLTAAYSLRRRFVRRLPGRVQNWLWLHTWFGIVSVLIALEHANYFSLLPASYSVRSIIFIFFQGALGMSALFALILLVMSGILGRLLDAGLSRIIAAEARGNGIGIELAVEEHLHEQALMIERLSAGKSEAFKHYCVQAQREKRVPSGPQPIIAPYEQADFQRLSTILTTYANLHRSLQRQQRARRLIRLWRKVHIPLACCALAIIGAHSALGLAKIALQLLLHR
jgi:FtsH-binding integral membrane protein